MSIKTHVLAFLVAALAGTSITPAWAEVLPIAVSGRFTSSSRQQARKPAIPGSDCSCPIAREQAAAQAQPDAPATSNKTLEVSLTRGSQNPGPLTVKCIYYARDLTAKTQVVHKVVETPVTLDNLSDKVTLPAVDFTVTEAAKDNRVVKGGKDYRGWQIQVLTKDGKLVGQAFSSPSLAEENKRGKLP